jgi:hypothetical protein
MSTVMNIARHATFRTLCGALALGIGSLAAAQTPPPVLEQRLHEEVQAVLLRLVDSGELTREHADALSLSAPASLQADLGAFFDVRLRSGDDRGLPVLGVTPGSSAAALGLRAGDRVVAVNGESLIGLGAAADGRARAVQQLRAALLASPDAVVLTVEREGGTQELRGAVHVVELPAYRLDLGAALANASLAAGSDGDGVSSCGRVSVFDIAPRGQRLYRAVLIAVDGALPGPTTSDVFRLTPGRHTLTVAEAIDARQFGELQRLQRDRSRRDRYKTLEIDVQPGITYRLAARFHLEERNSIRDGAYWEPVIWKETPETCR